MVKPVDALKKFAINMGVGVATDIVRGYLNDQLKQITPSDLYEAIVYDKELWSILPEDIKSTARKFRSAYRGLFDKFENQINTELVLKWIKEDQPELFSTLINIPPEYGDRAGIRWLDKQVNKIKQEIIYM